MKTKSGTLEYYLNLPYTVTLRRDEDGDFVARVAELSGCLAHGETQQEALDALREVQELWLTDRLERHLEIPLPSTDPLDDLPSGKWLQRVPRSLHRSLVTLARREGVSLNTLVSTLLADGAARELFSQPDTTHKSVELTAAHS